MYQVSALLLFLFSPQVWAQHAHIHPHADSPTGLFLGLRVDVENPPPGSAAARAFAFVEDAYVHVTYGSPFKRGRVIFGGVVGYGNVWAPGAHYATELVITDSLRVVGQVLEPGVYSLFATPEPHMWTIHLNSGLGIHREDTYDPAKDVLTFLVPVETLDEVQQQFIIDFEPVENGVDLRVSWDQTRVRFPIRPLLR